MSMIDEQADTTTAELFDELIFSIAAISTDAQRKRAIDLFRRFARQIETEAFRRGRDSISPAPADIAQATATGSLSPDDHAGQIPPVNWQA